MSDIGTSTTIKSANTHRRESRPERIDLGDGKEAIRNDIEAKRQGASERAINRDDAKGAPYLYIAGVKYRPIPEYYEFLQTKVQRNRPSRRRRTTSSSR